MIRSGAALTRQLLGFARGGKYEVKPTDLNDLIRKSSEMFGRTKKEIKITRREQESTWVVDADRGQIEQVFLNLYVNAWQAMPGGGELTLSTENVILDETFVKPHKMQAGRYVKVSVTDTGIGMDETTRQRVFEPFFTTKEGGAARVSGWRRPTGSSRTTAASSPCTAKGVTARPSTSTCPFPRAWPLRTHPWSARS